MASDVLFPDIPGWNNSPERADGLRIERRHGGFTIMPTDGRPMVSACPCCGCEFTAPRQAKLVANAIYPIQASQSSNSLSTWRT